MAVSRRIGLFSRRRDKFGKPSQYFEDIESKWISIVDISESWENFKAKVSVTSVQNISNTFGINGEHL
jgi:hypothetical protein